jgi:RNA polymerase sigma-70 factor, ECF subfamily
MQLLGRSPVSPANRPSRGEATGAEFADLYEEHVWQVYGFFGYRLGSRDEAEDLTQQTFERALRAWRRFDPERASPLTWLLAIARNLLIDHYRGLDPGRHQPLDDIDHPSEDPISDLSLGPSPELERALATLSERDRELIALRYGGDLSGPEIAELTGLTLANVQQILSRALRRLRIELEPGRGAAGSGGERADPEDADERDGKQRHPGARIGGEQQA